jgi:hypothetical protein
MTTLNRTIVHGGQLAYDPLADHFVLAEFYGVALLMDRRPRPAQPRIVFADCLFADCTFHPPADELIARGLLSNCTVLRQRR